MQQTKHFIEGTAAAHAGAIRACRYKQPGNLAEWLKGFDSVDRSHVVIRFPSNPLGKPLTTFQDSPDPVYIGNLNQCQDRAVSLSQADRAAFFAVYLADGTAYQYKGIGDHKKEFQK